MASVENASSKELDESRKANDILKAQVKGFSILLRQNAALENEVSRLCQELDEVTKGVVKRG